MKNATQIHGKNLTQNRFISLSYRNRGNVLRIIKNKNKTIINPTNVLFKNKVEVKYENKIILVYSARNSKVNPALENSKLYPEINSLSPSLKSNGARFVSARRVNNQINRKGNKNRHKLNLILQKECEEINNKIIVRSKINEIS